jgi:hypothetical protein
MDTINLYTVTNWHLIRYLWPNGTLIANTYSVYMGDESELQSKLDKLRRVSDYLADQVAVYANETITFTIHCNRG